MCRVIILRDDLEDMSGQGHIYRTVSRAFLAVLLVLASLILVACTSSKGGIFGGRPSFTNAVSVDDESRANPGSPIDTTPYVMATQTGGLQHASNEAVLDYSNSASGYIMVQNSMSQIKMMAIVNGPDGSQYKYSIAETGYFVALPLSAGNGSYQVDLYENVYANEYAPIFSQIISVELADEFAPFLYPNYYVNFSEGDQATQMSQELATNATSEVEAVDQIYGYIIENISYDYEKAATVQPGYHPNNDDTLATLQGICFDYASLIASMYRAQGFPTKLDVGYCGSAYHAWIEVYTSDEGWVNKKIEFPGNEYVRCDPTFDSTNNSSTNISSNQYVGDGKSYQTLFYY